MGKAEHDVDVVYKTTILFCEQPEIPLVPMPQALGAGFFLPNSSMEPPAGSHTKMAGMLKRDMPGMLAAAALVDPGSR